MPKVKQILNVQEAAVDHLLGDYARDNGFRLMIKPRLRDVIDVEDMELTSRERNFLFTSHLDFVAADTTNVPVLAIEYDGSQHWNDYKQRDRDTIKDRLCKAAGLDLLRIDNLYTRKAGRWQVLGYILEMHEIGKVFAEAQAQGSIPWDEPFIHTSIIDTTDPQRLTFTGLDMAAIERLQRLLATHSINWWGQWWRVLDGRAETRSLLALPNGQFLSSSCEIRQFAIEGISALQLAEELTTAELGWLTECYEKAEPVALSHEQGRRMLDELNPDPGKHTSTVGWSLHFSAGMPAT
ncbi:DUF2726 domain-containing protein [Ornithinimicrobium sp. Arc0846-15]|nr:DUF2726 domain-containing protein [Ornithinimicrobium laminariae]